MNRLTKELFRLILLILSVVGISACEGDSSAPGAVGQSGSMARFAISGDYLYTVGKYSLQVFDISDVRNPVKGEQVSVGFNIETIFTDQSALFIGSQNGMYIYDISDPGHPRQLSVYDHITSCDPVVTSGDYAYVTLRNGVDCRLGQNLLDVIDISDLDNPSLIASKAMINPHGLAIDDTLLYICEGSAGLKVLNVKNHQDIQVVNHLEGFHAFDIIHQNKKAIITGKDGILQYDVSDPLKIELLSQILIQNN